MARILVVDDDLFVRELIKEILASPEYTIDMAQDGLEAVEKVRKNKYDEVSDVATYVGWVWPKRKPTKN